MTSTRTFTRDQLDAIGLPDDIVSAAYVAEHPEYTAAHPGAAVELHREQVDTRRWVSVHELIFRAPDDGKAWRVTYEQGLTEHQDDHDPWNYDREVTATEVEQYEATVTAWRDVAEQAEADEDQRPVITVDLEQPAEPPAEPRRDDTVLCAHDYGLMRDSCPGCDHEQETPHDADPVTVRPTWAKRDMRRCRRCALVPSHKIHRATAAEAQR